MFDPITAFFVASVAATGASVYSSEKSRSQTKKANRVQERVRQTQDARSRVAQVRQARMAQSQVLQSGATQGAMGSSAVQGGYSAIGSNAENNIQFINQVDTMQQAISRRMESASNWSGAASAFSGVASITGSMAGSGKPTTKAPVTAGGTSNSNIGID
tara:strand:+ start:4163 stop:4639 length:477 start_codon:yes stop_codon:yes gene_type:complete